MYMYFTAPWCQPYPFVVQCCIFFKNSDGDFEKIVNNCDVMEIIVNQGNLENQGKLECCQGKWLSGGGEGGGRGWQVYVHVHGCMCMKAIHIRESYNTVPLPDSYPGASRSSARKLTIVGSAIGFALQFTYYTCPYMYMYSNFRDLAPLIIALPSRTRHVFAVHRDNCGTCT